MALGSKTLRVIITGDANGAIKEFAKLAGASEVAGKKTSNAGRNVALGFAAAGMAIAAFAIKSAKTYEDVGTQVLKLQRYTGATAEGASRLRAAFKLSGVDVDKAGKALGLFSKNLDAGKLDGFNHSLAGQHSTSLKVATATAALTAAQAKLSTVQANGKSTAAQVQTALDGVSKAQGKLTGLTNTGASALGKFGIQTRDTQGHLLPMHGILLQVADQFRKMPPGAERTALAMQLFGKAGADMLPFLVRGSAGIKELEKQSDKLGTTLGGKDLEAIKASKKANREFGLALEGLQLQIGRYVLPVMDKLVQFMSRNLPTATHAVGKALHDVGVVVGPLIKGFEMLPGPVKGGAAAFVGMAAALYPIKKVLDGFGTVFGPAIAGIKKLVTVQADGTRSISNFGKVLGALSFVGAVAGLAAYANELHKTKINSDAVLKGTTADLAKFGIAVSSIDPGALTKLGRESVPALLTMRAAVKAAGGDTSKFDEALKTVRAETARGVTNNKKYGESVGGVGDKAGPAKTALELAAAATIKWKKAAADAAAKLDALKSSISAVIDKAFGLESAADGVHSALNALPAVIKDVIKQGHGMKNVMNDNSDAGIALRAALRNVITSDADLVKAWIDQGVTGDVLKVKVAGLSASFVDQAVKMGIPRDVAISYASKLSAIPTNVSTTFHADTGPAKAEVDTLVAKLNGIPWVGTALQQQLQTYHIGGGASVQAQGGFYEAHNAMISRGGDMRVWSEPETGGEAYIPLSPAKRGRSMDILEQVASKFGKQLVSFAGGGVSGIGSSIEGRIVTHPPVSLVEGMLPGLIAAHTASMAAMSGGGSLGPISGGLIARIEAVIKSLESGGNYTIINSIGAAGAYQFLPGPWHGLGGPGASAAYASPAVQDAVAGRYIASILAKNGGNVASVPVTWYIGHYNPGENLNYTPPGNNISVAAYQARWMARFAQTAPSGGTPAAGHQAFHTGGTFRAPRPGGEGWARLRDGERISTPHGRGGGGDIHIHVAGSILSERDLVDVLAKARRRGLLPAGG